MDVLLKPASFILLVGGLIFVHELGHFVVAKLLGVKVVRFSIGFGPRLFGFRRGETEYRIALLPLGGYVKMAGDDPSEEPAPEDRGRGFLEQPPWKRLVIALAGPAMNLAFPVAVYFGMGLAQNGEPAPGPVVGTVTPGSPAAAAGLRPGDRVLAVAAPGDAPRPVRYFADLRELVSPHPGEALTFEVQRGGERLPLTVVPHEESESNPVETTRRGMIGVSPAYPVALVAPAAPGAAGPVEPLDLVVKVNGAPVRHQGDLDRALAEAGCRPVDLEVVREQPVPVPGASLSTGEAVPLHGVPTCAEGKPALVPAAPSVSTIIGAVVPGSPADQAGIRRGDAIASVNGKPVRTFRELDALGREFQVGTPVRIGLAGGRTVTLVPTAETTVDRVTRDRTARPVVGFLPDRRALVDPASLLADRVPLQRGAAEIAGAAWRQLVEIVRMTVLGIVRIVQGRISFKTVGGPIMLFSIASEAAEEGIGSFLFTMALISVNLGLMNLLPIPVLDGGHIAAALVEGVTRRPLSIRAREIANIVGLVLLFTLMLFVFKNDIVRIMG